MIQVEHSGRRLDTETIFNVVLVLLHGNRPYNLDRDYGEVVVSETGKFLR